MADSEICSADSPEEKTNQPQKNRGPTVTELVMRAVGASRDRKGMSLYVIKKELSTQGYDVEANGRHLKRAIRRLVDIGELIQTKGSYKVNKSKDKTVVRTEQPVVKKAAISKKTEKKADISKQRKKKANIGKQTKKTAAAMKPKEEVVKVKVEQTTVKLED